MLFPTVSFTWSLAASGSREAWPHSIDCRLSDFFGHQQMIRLPFIFSLNASCVLMQFFYVTSNRVAASRAGVKFSIGLILVLPHQASGQADGHNGPGDGL